MIINGTVRSGFLDALNIIIKFYYTCQGFGLIFDNQGSLPVSPVLRRNDILDRSS